MALASAGEPLWAGVPLASLEALGIAAPSLSHLAPRWRAPLEGGGVVDVAWYPTPEAARQAAGAWSTMTSQRPLPPLGTDRWGMEGDILLVRERNLVLWVRSLDGSADLVMAGLLERLVVEVDDQEWQTRQVEGLTIAWDGCGRPRVVGE